MLIELMDLEEKILANRVYLRSRNSNIDELLLQIATILDFGMSYDCVVKWVKSKRIVINEIYELLDRKA
jgi:hypothetical protein